MTTLISKVINNLTVLNLKDVIIAHSLQSFLKLMKLLEMIQYGKYEQSYFVTNLILNEPVGTVLGMGTKMKLSVTRGLYFCPSRISTLKTRSGKI